jgi:hypothetical protein
MHKSQHHPVSVDMTRSTMFMVMNLACTLMTLSIGDNSSGLQVQSVVARVNFPHERTRI